MKTSAKQYGFSFGGFIMLMFVLVFVLIFGMKLIPSYMENATIQKAFNVIVKDPEMLNAPVRNIKESFQKRAISIDNVTVIKADDVVISSDGRSISLSASYSKTIPLVGNISLLLEFNPSASN